MSELILAAKAPANVALIKYMGKKDKLVNLPENVSVSLTLSALSSLAEIEIIPGASPTIRFLPELPKSLANDKMRASFEVPQLGDHGMAKAIRHVERVASACDVIFPRLGLGSPRKPTALGALSIRTANSFPASSGIASSASSFAAITLATAFACAPNLENFKSAWAIDLELRRALARVSREGSGSSCRSFEGPWVLWDDENAASIQTRMPKMAHFVIVVSAEPKKISSSEAHLRVKTSPLWDRRADRAEARSRLLMLALGEADLESIARIAWTESWEMHSLFHTCAEPFSYWDGGTVDLLQWFAPRVRERSPPIVTLDAGPNIHVIVEETERNRWRERLRESWGRYLILEDQQGTGAEVVG